MQIRTILAGCKMPRFKQIPEIQQLMGRKELIRNIGIIAHIDHGKTTLADSLLAGTGLLSTKMAGMARVLDYLEEEQKRKITIKTANITLLYKTAGAPYIINLVDTPGHVDFTGKVTRAITRHRWRSRGCGCCGGNHGSNRNCNAASS